VKKTARHEIVVTHKHCSPVLLYGREIGFVFFSESLDKWHVFYGTVIEPSGYESWLRFPTKEKGATFLINVCRKENGNT
jgi:hypothetical protein